MADRAAPAEGVKTAPSPDRVCVVMAAYNEAGCIGEIVSTIIDLGHRVIVVDDGSTDGTGVVAQNMGARVLTLPTNFGQGQGLIVGFKAALQEDCDVIIEMDADGQHDAHAIEGFIDAMDNQPHDIVVGSRVTGRNHPNAPFFRRFFLPYVTQTINLLTGYRMTDAMCGFRAFRTASLRRSAYVLDEILEPQYIAAEMFVRFARAGLTVGEIPIILTDRKTGASTKGLFRYGYGVISAILRSF